MTTFRSGAELLCDALEQAGVEFVFGVPGTQTVEIYDALRSSRIRAVVPTHELAAAFMANGYARASGKPGVILTISGPGVAFVPAGLAEARLDGVPLVHFSIAPATGPTAEPSFQAFDQAALLRPLVKGAFRANGRSDIPSVVREALALAAAPDPGPVFVEFAPPALREQGVGIEAFTAAAVATEREPNSHSLDAILDALSAAQRPVLLVACDCSESAESLATLAAAGRLPIVVPTPHRGVLPEDDPWTVCSDDQRTSFNRIQEFVASADLVVVLGTRLTHVATAGFCLALAPERVVCVSDTGSTLPHGYSARLIAGCAPKEFLSRAMSVATRFVSTWSGDELAKWQQRFAAEKPADPPEPLVNGGTPASFFAALRAALPRNAILVTDSGLHQVLTRRHFQVLAPRGFIFPSEFQSMAFGLPAALGAKLAAPSRPVVVVIGDGGFAMSGLDLLTAARDSIPVVVIVFNDGQLNLIRLQQAREFGRSHGVELLVPDLAQFARAVSVGYGAADDDLARVVRGALSSPAPTLVEVIVSDSRSILGVRAKSLARETVRRAIGQRAVSWLKRRLG